MFQNDKMLDKPCDGGLWVHTIFTKERIGKWDGSLLGSEVKNPYKITLGKKCRVIRMILTASEKIELNPEFVGHKLFIS